MSLSSVFITYYLCDLYDVFPTSLKPVSLSLKKKYMYTFHVITIYTFQCDYKG